MHTLPNGSEISLVLWIRFQGQSQLSMTARSLLSSREFVHDYSSEFKMRGALWSDIEWLLTVDCCACPLPISNNPLHCSFIKKMLTSTDGMEKDLMYSGMELTLSTISCKCLYGLHGCSWPQTWQPSLQFICPEFQLYSLHTSLSNAS